MKVTPLRFGRSLAQVCLGMLEHSFMSMLTQNKRDFLRTTQLTTLSMGIGITPMKLMLVVKREHTVPLFGKR
jgi:hypothetical protein